jgi:hypothetical protein
LCYEQNPEWDPWDDPLERDGILLPNEILGTSPPSTKDVNSVNCAYGYEGNMRIIPREEDEDRAGDQVYMTCHYVIKVPSWVEEYSITLIVLGTLFGIGGSIGYYYYRQWLQRVWMRKKAEKRRSRKSSESSVGNIGGGGGRSSSRVVGSRRAKSSGKVKGSRSKSGDKKKKKKKKGKKKKKKKSKG